jgi:hypothetical protein
MVAEEIHGLFGVPCLVGNIMSACFIASTILVQAPCKSEFGLVFAPWDFKKVSTND